MGSDMLHLSYQAYIFLCKHFKYILHSNLIMNLRKSYAYPIKKQLKSRRFSIGFLLWLWGDGSVTKQKEILLTEKEDLWKQELTQEQGGITRTRYFGWYSVRGKVCWVCTMQWTIRIMQIRRNWSAWRFICARERADGVAKAGSGGSRAVGIKLGAKKIKSLSAKAQKWKWAPWKWKTQKSACDSKLKLNELIMKSLK